MRVTFGFIVGGFSVIVLWGTSSCNVKEAEEIQMKIPIPRDVNTLDASERNYRKVAADLYMDKGGVIYYRTIDVSAAEGNRHPKRGVYSYNSMLFLDTIIDQDTTFCIVPIYSRVDTLTFRRKPDDSNYPGYAFYEDSGHRYYSIERSDGGVLQAVRKK